MRTRQEIVDIIQKLCTELALLFPGDSLEAILFGSYARADADQGSDIDVMILVDSSRAAIAEKNWAIGDLAAEFLLNYGIVVSPIVENREFFQKNAEILPFYRNVMKEGVKLSA